MKSTTIRKVTTLGVGLSLLAAGLTTAGPASATLCYYDMGGVRVSYHCYAGPDDPEQLPPPPVVVAPRSRAVWCC